MYRTSSPGQLSFENFYLPFGGHLKADNRWAKLAELIPWEDVEASYAEQFSSGMGAPAKSLRVALGSLIIKEKLGTSDEETVQQIRENPYLQYFLGYSEYQDEAPFDASMLVHFRKRLSLEMVAQVNEQLVAAMLCEAQASAEVESATDSPTTEVLGEGNDYDDDEQPPPPNQGQLILDATCAPADIRYPTDLGLLNEARRGSEALIDSLYSQVSSQLTKKPRTYRRVARKRYLAVAKKRRPSRQLRRKGIRQQLNYLSRNLGHIDRLIALGASLTRLSRRRYRQLLIIHEVYRQQREMYEHKVRRVDDRIVSLSQPYVRPIVRGKAGVPVEFGAKLSVSCVNGCVFLDVLSWDNFNESTHLQAQAAAYRTRFGHYPASIHADQIYRTRDNRRWCKARGIRLSGPPLGRPQQDPQVQAELKQQAREDEAVRVAIEGKFGRAKRRFSLDRVMPKLAETAQCAIAITFLVLNLERWLRLLLAWLFWLFVGWRSALEPLLAFQEAVRNTLDSFIAPVEPHLVCHCNTKICVGIVRSKRSRFANPQS
ncbi:MAG: IS5 family transposase [Cyanobacteria bacterium J06634_6]